MQQPSVSQPSLIDDPFRAVALAAWKRADDTRKSNEAKIARLLREIEDAEREAQEIEDAYREMLAGGPVDERLWPDCKKEIGKEARALQAEEIASVTPGDHADLHDLALRLKGSNWSVSGKPVRKNGDFKVTLIHARKTQKNSEARNEDAATILAQLDNFKDRWLNGHLAYTPDTLHEMPVSDALKLPFEIEAGPTSVAAVVEEAPKTIEEAVEGAAREPP